MALSFSLHFLILYVDMLNVSLLTNLQYSTVLYSTETFSWIETSVLTCVVDPYSEYGSG